MLQHIWVKYRFKAQNKPINFNVTEFEKFMDMVSDSVMQFTFKKLAFGVASKNSHKLFKKVIKMLPFPSIELRFLKTYQPKHHNSFVVSLKYVHRLSDNPVLKRYILRVRPFCY